MSLLDKLSVSNVPWSSDWILDKHSIPPVLPASIRDVDHMGLNTVNIDYESYPHMSDPCPICGGFNMSMGDYIHIGACLHCYDELMEWVP